MSTLDRPVADGVNIKANRKDRKCLSLSLCTYDRVVVGCVTKFFVFFLIKLEKLSTMQRQPSGGLGQE